MQLPHWVSPLAADLRDLGAILIRRYGRKARRHPARYGLAAGFAALVVGVAANLSLIHI